MRSTIPQLSRSVRRSSLCLLALVSALTVLANWSAESAGIPSASSLRSVTAEQPRSSRRPPGEVAVQRPLSDWPSLFANRSAITSLESWSKAFDSSSRFQDKNLQPAATFTVTNIDDSGQGSLRQAILDTNANAGTDTIAFKIPGAGVHTISPTSSLPLITGPVIIDGTSQPGFVGSPIIELNGAAAGTLGLILPGSSTVRGLVINRFNASGITLRGTGNVVEGNYIGTDVTGTVNLGNSGAGVLINGPSSGNTIGGATITARNIISGNGNDGIQISDNGSTANIVQGNYIGTDVTGTAKLGNASDGVEITFFASDNTIGGTTLGARNVISGNSTSGIGVSSNSTGNLVQGNYIGTDVNGTVALGNSGLGVSISSANNTIGGTAAGARNIVSGNGNGIGIFGNTATANQVQGNY